MGEGDVLHVIISGESEESVALELYAASDPVNYEFSGWTAVTDYDGNAYNTVIINGQEWLLENLKTTHYADGTAITYVTDDITWVADTVGAYCYYSYDIGYRNIYGALYNWYAVDNAHELVYIERDGVQETDWRVPTYTDFVNLMTFAGGVWGGGTLKEAGLSHWATPNYNATNSTGFTALPAGINSMGSGAAYLYQFAQLWSATADTTFLKYYMRLRYDDPSITIGSMNRGNGLSVRLVRDL